MLIYLINFGNTFWKMVILSELSELGIHSVNILLIKVLYLESSGWLKFWKFGSTNLLYSITFLAVWREQDTKISKPTYNIIRI